mgnify:CR=1 FL=1
MHNKLVWVTTKTPEYTYDPRTTQKNLTGYGTTHAVGRFLEFSTYFEEINGSDGLRGVGQVPVALVEMPDGSVDIVDTHKLKFIYDGDPEWLPPKAK